MTGDEATPAGLSVRLCGRADDKGGCDEDDQQTRQAGAASADGDILAIARLAVTVAAARRQQRVAGGIALAKHRWRIRSSSGGPAAGCLGGEGDARSRRVVPAPPGSGAALMQTPAMSYGGAAAAQR
ncbi:hypothetical protein Scep_028029 [Stephania cephalantha]|uniref:Uncharacterized protein n=1 Tax=Stephania cephalantha TaxID=152367 RepID=A0AAP0HLD7_9MAGN